ncbi:MAG: c-type cytochrome [Anaerolineales bacterium]|nr:c-type cytochrome [Anaerolineales bacterium]
MRTFGKWLLIFLAGLLGIAVAGLVALYVTTNSMLEKVYEVEPVSVHIPSRRPAELTGFQQMMVSFCTDCHGPAFGGQIIDDDPLVGMLAAPNLTSGEGGIGRDFSDEDWVRAIRHGVDEDGTPLLVMPSNTFNFLNEEDLGVIIAYVKAQPPVDNTLPKPSIGPIGRLFTLQDPSVLPAETIDHTAPISPPSEPGVTIERGAYVAVLCEICHGPDLSGGPNASSGLNLTPAGNLSTWTEAEFIHSIRTGIKPDGTEFDPVEMPWKQIGILSNDDLKSIWLYLQGLPAVEN